MAQLKTGGHLSPEEAPALIWGKNTLQVENISPLTRDTHDLKGKDNALDYNLYIF